MCIIIYSVNIMYKIKLKVINLKDMHILHTEKNLANMAAVEKNLRYNLSLWIRHLKKYILKKQKQKTKQKPQPGTRLKANASANVLPAAPIFSFGKKLFRSLGWSVEIVEAKFKGKKEQKMHFKWGENVICQNGL